MLQEIVYTANIGFVVVGPKLDVRLWNRWMVQMTGIESEIACCKTLPDLIPSVRQSGLLDNIENALTHGVSVRLPSVDGATSTGLGPVNILVQPLKAKRYLHSLRPQTEENKDPLCLIQFSMKTGQRLVAPVAVKEQAGPKQNSARLEFLATVGHQIRTPVNGVLGIADLLAGTNLTHEQRRYVELLMKSGQSLLGFVNEMTDLSRLEAGQEELSLEPTILPRLIEDVMSLFASTASSKGVRAIVDMAPNLPGIVRTDARKLRQILVNLLSNAFKFTDRGTVTLAVAYSGRGRGGGLSISVADTGVGIPPNRLGGLFEKLRMESGGVARLYNKTGLGLFIVKEVMDLFGGDVSVESAVGKGTIFRVTLPAEIVTQTLRDDQQSVSEASGMAELGPWNVLVAEDNMVNQLLITKMLEGMGHSVTMVSNGRDAVNAVQMKAPFDIILMDISMPVMDGLEATALIRSLLGRIGQTPILALTAHAMDGDREIFLEAGMDGYLSKPVDAELLAQTMAELVTARSNLLAKSENIKGPERLARLQNAQENWRRSREADQPHESDLGDR